MPRFQPRNLGCEIPFGNHLRVSTIASGRGSTLSRAGDQHSVDLEKSKLWRGNSRKFLKRGYLRDDTIIGSRVSQPPKKNWKLPKLGNELRSDSQER